MSTPTLMRIPRSMIRVDSSTNPRKEVDNDKLDELVRSIQQHGLLQSLTVRPIVEAGADQPVAYELIAGHRRLMALDVIHSGASDFEVGATITESPKEVAALIENVVREDLTPLEEAIHFKQFADAGITPQGIAEMTGLSLQLIKARLSILELDEEVTWWVGKGEISTACVKNLVSIHRHSPALAKEVARTCRKRTDYQGSLAKRPQEVVEFVAAMDSKPFWCVPGQYDFDEIRKLIKACAEVEDSDKTKLIERLASFNTANYQARLTLYGETFDTLTGAGEAIPTDKKDGRCVIHTPGPMTYAAIDSAVKEKERHRAAVAKANAEAKARRSSVDPTSPKEDQEAQKKAESEARKKMAERAREDRGHNINLGRKLLVERVQPTSDVIRMICLELIAAIELGHVAKTGLRLVLEQMQTVEETKGKDGETKQKVTYLLNIGECKDAAEEWIKGASTTEELLHRTVSVLLAAEGALQTAVAESARTEPRLSDAAKELRRKLVEPYLAGGAHTKRVKRQWEAVDGNRQLDWQTGRKQYPEGLHLVDDEPEPAA